MELGAPAESDQPAGPMVLCGIAWDARGQVSWGTAAWPSWAERGSSVGLGAESCWGPASLSPRS